VRTRLALVSAATGGALALTGALFASPAYADVAPVAHDDNYSTPVNTNLVIGAPGVLSNDTDADGDPLTVKNVIGAQHGKVSVAANGAFTYVPTTNYVGPDQFTYDACEVLTPAVLQARQLDAVPCDTATVFITVKGTTPPPTTTTVPPPVGGGRPVYPNCRAAFNAGVHDIPRGDPAYRLVLDRDRDGIACEINGDDTNPPVTVVRPPGNTTIVKPPPAPNNTTIVVPPAQPPANTFITPQAPSTGAVATGDGSLAGS
jgi:hypothetical protein